MTTSIERMKYAFDIIVYILLHFWYMFCCLYMVFILSILPAHWFNTYLYNTGTFFITVISAPVAEEICKRWFGKVTPYFGLWFGIIEFVMYTGGNLDLVPTRIPPLLMHHFTSRYEICEAIAIHVGFNFIAHYLQFAATLFHSLVYIVLLIIHLCDVHVSSCSLKRFPTC